MSSFQSRLLTNLMIETLMDCHERELMNLEPYDAGSTVSIKSLISRGMLSVKQYISASGKSYQAVYVTHNARKYLNTFYSFNSGEYNQSQYDSL